MPFKKRFVIFAEGETEDSYFRILGEIYNADIDPKRRRKQGSPAKLLQEAKRFESKYNKTKHTRISEAKSKYETWVVVDKDINNNEDLQAVQNWSQEQKYRGFALSNPKFELWLLLHFYSYGEASRAVSNKTDEKELKKFFPQYKRNKKIVSNGNINHKNINDAIEKSKKLSCSPENCTNIEQYINDGNFTTVFRLVENIIKANS